MCVTEDTTVGVGGGDMPSRHLSGMSRFFKYLGQGVIRHRTLSHRDVGLCACCGVTLFRWNSGESIVFPHDLRWYRHKDLSQECGIEKPPEGLESPCVAVAMLGTLDSISRASGVHFSLAGESPDYWTRSHRGGVALEGGKLNFLEDVGTQRIHGSDSGVLSVLRGWI